ncbi:hypothetical protein [Lactococcus lactis]|uniref:hypothetical protein n=1 Tax=Lactococcus lactis TaxID=1358 RepID=UPI000692551D|nr:hypothetical protein [Lactococcus lactis]WBM78474.1 hypothetical protein OHI04_05460 [Lactococcus lactis]WSP32923.1 hypothetical protein VVB72_05455 [Lactococcus lactis subsp. lactis]
MKIVASNSITVSNVNDGTITHTAYANSADGTDGFTTVYPNLNLLEDGKFAKPINSNWITDGTTISKDAITGYFKVQFNGSGSLNRTYYGGSISTIPIGQKYSVYIKAYSLESSLNIKLGSVNTSQAVTVTNNSNIPKTYKVEGLVRGDSNTFGIFGGLTTTRGTLFISEIKVEPGSVATPYMPSASEVTTADYPSFIGQYSDFTQADSTNPSDYTWSVMRGNDGKDGADGKDGVAGNDGKGIKATAITYQASTNGTTAPTGTWSASVPTVAKGSFLWTRTIWTYTDNTTETGYAVAYMGTNGNNGNDGIAGKDGVGIKTTTITYAGSTSGTTAPTSGWTSTVPTVAAGSYLWTKTVWTYTDNTSETGYSVAKMGNNGATGPRGPAGSDGNPGKIVSDTEPTTRFKDLTWKYSGTTDLTASDGTIILSGTEYYWSGTKWILNEINSHNINGDNLNVTNGTFTDGKIKSIWNSGVLSGSTEIENSHINMSATDSTSNATNSLGLDIQQGFSMRWTDPASNQSRSVLLNYGGLVFGKEGVGAGLLFDGTNLSSSMPIQAPNTIIKSTQFSVSGIGIRLDRLMSFVVVTFFGQASSTISNSPTINNMIPAGFRPINPYSIDYMVPGNSANSGYIYFNPDGSIRIMATINSGYYIRGTRLYITNDVYPS